VSASTRPTSLSLTKAYFPTPFTRSWQKSFDASHEVCTRQVKNLSKLKDRGKRGAIFAAFQQAYVLWVVPALEGKSFLREMTFEAQLAENPRKRSLLCCALFIPGCHPQLGVCCGSMNTSTKYSIPARGGCLPGNTLKSSGLEAA